MNIRTWQERAGLALGTHSCDIPYGLEYHMEAEIKELRKALITQEQALKAIANWKSHTAEFSIDFGSNGVRDFYRNVARKALNDD